MRRIPPIRITKNDEAEYARLVRNTKAKIRRTAKNYGVDLSNEVELPPLQSFTTRAQFNAWKQQAESFTSRYNLNYQYKKNKYGVVATKKEINEITRMTHRAQELAKKRIKEAEKKPFISGGKEQGTVGQQMKQMSRPNAAGINVPSGFNFENISTRSRLEKKRESMEQRAKGEFYDRMNEQMKENYIHLLEKSYNSDADDLVRKLKEMPAEDFYEMYLMFDEFDFNLEYVTAFYGQPHGSRLQQMETYIDRYNQGKINMDLKGF